MHRPNSTTDDGRRSLWRHRPDSATSTVGTPSSEQANMSTPWPWLSFAVFKDGSYTVNLANQNQPVINKPAARPLGTSRTSNSSLATRRRMTSGGSRRSRTSILRSSTPLQNDSATREDAEEDQVPLSMALRSSSTSGFSATGRSTPIGMTLVSTPTPAPAVESTTPSPGQRPSSGTIVHSKFGRRYRIGSGSARPNSVAKSAASVTFTSTNHRVPTPFSSVAQNSSGLSENGSTSAEPPADKGTLSFSYMTYINGTVSPGVTTTTTSTTNTAAAEPSTTPVATTPISGSQNQHTPIFGVSDSLQPVITTVSTAAASSSPSTTTASAITKPATFSQNSVEHQQQLQFQPPSVSKNHTNFSSQSMERRPPVAPPSILRVATSTPSSSAAAESTSTEVLPIKSILKKGGGSAFTGVRWISAGSRPHTNVGTVSRQWTASVPQGPRLMTGALQRSNSFGSRMELHRRGRPVNLQISNGDAPTAQTPTPAAEAMEKPQTSQSRPNSAKRGVRFNMDNVSVHEYDPPENRYSNELPLYTSDSDQWYRMMWRKLADY